MQIPRRVAICFQRLCTRWQGTLSRISQRRAAPPQPARRRHQLHPRVARLERRLVLDASGAMVPTPDVLCTPGESFEVDLGPTLIQLDEQGNLHITDTSRDGIDDQIVLGKTVLDGKSYIVIEQQAPIALDGEGLPIAPAPVLIPEACVTGQIIVDLRGGDDLLTLNLSQGSPLTEQGLIYDGGTQSVTQGVHDGLSIYGSGTEHIDYRPDASLPGNGLLIIDGASIAFSNLEPIDVTNVASATLEFPGIDDQIIVTNGLDFFDPRDRFDAIIVSGTSDGIPFESIALWDIDSVTIDTSRFGGTNSDGSDTVLIRSADNNHQINNLHFITGAGSDTITFEGRAKVTETFSINSESADVFDALNTGSVAIEATDAFIQAGTLGTGINALRTQVATLDATASVGSLRITESNGASMELSAVANITVDNLANSLTLLRAESFDFADVLIETTDSMTVSGLVQGADVTLRALADITLQSNALLSSTGGSVILEADSGPGNSGGNFSMLGNARIQAGTSTVQITADGRITLSNLQTDNNTADAIRITSFSSDIVDGGDNQIDLVADVAGAQVHLNSVTGIGQGNAIETRVAALSANVTGRGSIEVDESTEINLLDVHTRDGLIDIIAGGTLTATQVQSDNISSFDNNDPLNPNGLNADIRLATRKPASDILVSSILAANGADVRLNSADDVLDTNAKDGLFITADDLQIESLNQTADGNAIDLTTNINDLTLDVLGTLPGDATIRELNTIQLASSDAAIDSDHLATGNGAIVITAATINIIDQNPSNEGAARTNDPEIIASGDRGRVELVATNTLLVADGVQIFASRSTVTDLGNGNYVFAAEVPREQAAVYLSAGTEVIFGESVQIQTGNGTGVARIFTPRPDIGITDSAFFEFDRVLTDKLTSEPGGFGGNLMLEVGRPGEKGLVVDIDWGAATGRFQQVGGLSGDTPQITIHHQYTEADILDSQLNGRPSATSPLEVRFAVSHHPSIQINAPRVTQAQTTETVIGGLVSSTDDPATVRVLENGKAQFIVPNLAVPVRLFFPPAPLPVVEKRTLVDPPPAFVPLTRQAAILETTVQVDSVVREEYFQIRALSPDPRIRELAPPERLPDDILSGNKLQLLFSQLFDGTYQIEYVLGAGNERLILRVEIRDGQATISGTDEVVDGLQLEPIESTSTPDQAALPLVGFMAWATRAKRNQSLNPHSQMGRRLAKRNRGTNPS